MYVIVIKYIVKYFDCRLSWDLHRINYVDLLIGVGMHDIENPNEGYIVAIANIILHPDFKSDYLHDTNDIALIRLRQSVKIDENVKPVCLPHKGQFPVIFR